MTFQEHPVYVRKTHFLCFLQHIQGAFLSLEEVKLCPSVSHWEREEKE